MHKVLFIMTVFIINILIFSSCNKKNLVDSENAATVEDIDGNVYQTIQLGVQIWMAENLRVTHYRNGDAIPKVTENADWTNLTTGAYCEYDNNACHTVTYGYLYNWHAVHDSRQLAPAGWHVPTDEDWKTLEMTLGMSQLEVNGTQGRGTDEGGKLKEMGTAHWQSPNTGATDESGFTALPGGNRNFNGIFYSLGSYAIFWSATESSVSHSWFRSLAFDNSSVHRYYDYKQDGFSVRLVKD